MANVVEVEDVRVHFPVAGDGLLKSLDGISLTVIEGEVLGVIGESGSGKSTLGRTIVGLQRPTSGSVRHGGVEPFRLDRAAFARHRRNYAFIFQDPNAALNPRMTIGQSIREPMDIAGTTPRARRESRVAEALERVGLSAEQGRRYPGALSGGQKQRANIARALLMDPSLVVCDEVVAALDVSIQADILNLFADLQRQLGLTYIFISHDLRVVAHVSDRVAVLYLGKLVELGPTGLVLRAPLHPYTQALLSAEPHITLEPGVVRRRIMLQGEIPSPLNPPSGCVFRTRCWQARDRCAVEVPQPRSLADGRVVACHEAAL